jgi:hypothetical protein
MSAVDNPLNAARVSSTTKPVLSQEVFPPGLQVEIRDAEWVVRRADLTSNGTHSVLVTAISELVRSREARSLTELGSRCLTNATRALQSGSLGVC